MKIKTIIALGLILIVHACNREVPLSSVNTETFTKVIPEPGDQYMIYMAPIANNNYLVIAEQYNGVQESSYPLDAIILDNKGQVVSKSRLGDKISNAFCNQLADGSIIFNTKFGNKTSGSFGKIDANGNLVFVTTYKSNFVGQYSYPTQLKDGSFLVMNSNGNASAGSSTNQMVVFTPEGKVYKNYTLFDTDFGAKILQIGAYKCDTLGSYNFVGYCFPNWNGDWNTNPRLFVAQQVYKGATLVKNIVKIIDPNNTENENNSYHQLVAKNGDLVLLATQKQLDGVKKLKIIRVNSNLDVILDKDIKIGTKGTTAECIIESSDGNYLIGGSVNLTEKNAGQAFSAKIDQNGNIVWTKVFTSLLSGSLRGIIESGDGSYLFSGHTNGYGKGSDKNDIFILRTDANRNIE